MVKATESPRTSTRFGGHVVKRPYSTGPRLGMRTLQGESLPFQGKVVVGNETGTARGTESLAEANATDGN